MTDDVPRLRTSERRAFKRCQQRWWWGYRQGLVSRGAARDALWFGTGIHLALAEWYCGPGTKRGPHPAETWQKFCKDEFRTVKIEQPGLWDEVEARYVEAEALGIAMMQGYVEKYGRDEQKLIISPEKTFRLDVPWPKDQVLYDVSDPSELLVAYVGTFDGVWRDADTGWLWLDEHKTAKAVSTGHLPMDDQAGGYWAVAERTLKAEGLIKDKERLRGIEYNFLRKALPDDRPRDAEGYYCNNPIKAHYQAALQGIVPDATLPKMTLKELQEYAAGEGLIVLGERSKQQPKPLFERHQVHRTAKERAQQLRRVQDEAFQMRVVRDGLLPLTLNPTRDCSWDCEFYNMCELNENGAHSGSVEEFRRLQFRVQDPYADHRKSTDE